MRRFIVLAAALCLFGLCAMDASAQEAWVSVCHGYGCAAESLVHFEAEGLEALRERLALADSPVAERALLAGVIGSMYRVAGQQTLVGADRGGNFADEEHNGRMDCIDHSTSTTRLLRLLEARGGLRFHRVLEPERRVRVIFQHFSAVIEEIGTAAPPEPEPAVVAAPAQCDCDAAFVDIPPPGRAQPASLAGRYVVDSWFVDNGEPAVVLPLADWLDGEGPNVQ